MKITTRNISAQEQLNKDIKKIIYIHPIKKPAVVGLLLAGILLATALFFGITVQRNQFATQNNNVPIQK